MHHNAIKRISQITKLAGPIPTGYLLAILLFWYIIFDFLISASLGSPFLRSIISRYWLTASLLFLLGCFLFYIFLFPRLKQNEHNPACPLILLSPIALLPLWPAERAFPPFFIPIIIVSALQLFLYKILFSQRCFLIIKEPRRANPALAIIIASYLLIFSYLSIRKFTALEFFNPKDVGLFNQIFWNIIHGRFFLNSTYGSHFACHNSPFFLFLAPFYCLFPHPFTLLVSKTLLLSLSAIPFYLITKDILGRAAALPMAITFLFYPLIAAQNFTPAHESGYAPFFVFFTYYFFNKNKFMPFMCFLLVTVSIKEPYALLAVAFACYAFFQKKRLVWIMLPLLMGIAWFILSIAIINNFQNLYHPHSDSAWYFVYLKKALLLLKQSGIGKFATYALSNSNMLNPDALRSLRLLFLPLAIIFPLLSPVSLLGLPEFIVNLSSSNPNMFSPLWHYSIVLSCFLLIGTAEGIKKVSAFINHKRYLKIDEQKIRLLLCACVLSFTLICSPAWLGLTEYKNDPAYVKKIKEALALVPPEASISVPARVAIIVSNREKYSIIGDKSGDGRDEDYVLMDNPEAQKSYKSNINSDYEAIFNMGTITLYKRRK